MSTLPSRPTFAEIDERFHTVTADQQLRVAALMIAFIHLPINTAIDAILAADNLAVHTHDRERRLRDLLDRAGLA